MIIRALLLTLVASFPTLAAAKSAPNALYADSLNMQPSAIMQFPFANIVDDYLQIRPVNGAQLAALSITALDTKLNPHVAKRAIEAMYCALDTGMVVEKIIVVDMNLKASEKRLWAFDMKDPQTPRLVISERVAHGSGSDPKRVGKAEQFSNVQNSHMTSLGLYKIAERYRGKHGWSRRLDGMFAKWNGKARDRAVVMHPSNYVSEQRVGNSQGCPAVNQATMDTLEKAGLKNAVLWIDGPDKNLEREVADCAQKREAKLRAIAARDRKAARDEQLDARTAYAWTALQSSPMEGAAHGWTEITTVDAVPQPWPGERLLPCGVAMPRPPRSSISDCPAAIDTMALFNRLI